MSFYSLFSSQCKSGAFSALGGKTMTDLLLLLKYTAGKLPIQDMRQDFKGEENLASPFDLLEVTLGTAIDELTRPIDAIRPSGQNRHSRHQSEGKRTSRYCFRLAGNPQIFRERFDLSQYSDDQPHSGRPLPRCGAVPFMTSTTSMSKAIRQKTQRLSSEKKMEWRPK